MKTKNWLIALAGAVVVVGIGAGVVMAQTPGSGTPAAGTSFLDRIAQKLGIDTPKLQDAVTAARNDQIDAAVKNGDLTQKQADILKSQPQNRPDGGAFGFGFEGPGKHGFGPGMPGGFGHGMDDGGQKLAGFLNISTDQLRSELAAPGATLASVATAHGKDRDALKAFITGDAKSTLDAKVQSGDLTQKQEDQMLSDLSARLDSMIDGKPGGGKHGFGPRMPGGLGAGLDDGGQKLAGFLNISTEQLRSELAATGATLASVANAHGRDRDALKAFITSDMKATLDAKIQSGDLTQKQEDQMLSALGSQLDRLIDGKPGGRQHRGFKFGPGGPAPGATPSVPTQGGGFYNLFQS